MSKFALMFHGKFHRIKAINVREKNIVQMGPLTAEIKNNDQQRHQGLEKYFAW